MEYGGYQGRGRHKTSGQLRPVTYLPNVSEWVEQIYCLECADPTYNADQILGGVDGVANAPIQALANRTNALYDRLGLVIDALNALMDASRPQLDTIKSIVTTKTEPTDTQHTAWLNLGINVDNPYFELIYESGLVVSSPTFQVMLEDGTVWYLRTDGTDMHISHIEV